MNHAPLYFVFDVLSVGPFGPPFAVAWNELDATTGAISPDGRGYALCTPWAALAKADFCPPHPPADETEAAMIALRGGVLARLPHPTCDGPNGVTDAFYTAWTRARARGAEMAAAALWPSCGRFLTQMSLGHAQRRQDNVVVRSVLDISGLCGQLGVAVVPSNGELLSADSAAMTLAAALQLCAPARLSAWFDSAQRELERLNAALGRPAGTLDDRGVALSEH